MTCLALSTPTNARSAPTLFAGCWDRTIWSWNTSSRERGVHFRNGHRDFVKCITWTIVGTLSVLISGSADTTIVLWDANSGAKLQVLQGHSMAVAAIAIDPSLGDEDDDDGTDQGNNTQMLAKLQAKPRTLFSASARSINQWTIIPTPTNPLSKLMAAASPDVSGPLTPSDGTIYALTFPYATTEDPDPDLWLTSADGAILSLSRDDDWSVTETLNTAEGHHVRTIAISEDRRFIAAAGRDEDVYVWDMRSGPSASTVKQLPKFDGHFDEVVSLLILGKGIETRVVSGSLDCTLRTWNLGFIFAPDDASPEDLDFTNRLMAGNAFDNAHLIPGGDDPVVGEANPDDIAVHLGVTAEELHDLNEMLDDGEFGC